MAGRSIVVLMLVVQSFSQEFYLLPTNIIPSESNENHGVRLDPGRRLHHRHRTQGLEEVRGQSFGLEKFLTQPFNLEEIEDKTKELSNQNYPPKPRNQNRGSSRPHKKGERGQTFGLENITPQIFQLEHMIKNQDSAEISVAEEENFDMKRTSKIQDRRPITFDNPFQTTETPTRQRTRYREYSDEVINKQPKRPEIEVHTTESNAYQRDIINKKLQRRPEIEIKPTESDNYPQDFFLPTIQTFEEPKVRPHKRVNKHKNLDDRKPLERPQTFQTTSETPANVEQIPVNEKQILRPRKRVTLRRRRKKPQKNSEDENVEINKENLHTESESIRQQEEEVKEEKEALKQSEVESQKSTDHEEKKLSFEFQEEKSTKATEMRPKRKRPLGFRKQELTSTAATTEDIPIVYTVKESEPEIKKDIVKTLPITDDIDVTSEENIIESKKIQKKENVEEESVALDEKKDKTETEKGKTQVEASGQPSAHHLKTLLKQQGGTLSLSEILQTQNLSLSDFLKGNKGAITALGGKKVDTEDKKPEEQRESDKRYRIPKISPKSRPFSKSPNDVGKGYKEAIKTEDKDEEILPKTLDVFEVTTERASYNGFQPKHPRLRPGHGKAVKKVDAETTTENVKSFVPTKQREYESKQINSRTTENPNQSGSETTTKSFKRDRLRIQSSRLPPTANPKETSNEPKFTPKRFGDLRPKLRIDRRKTTSTTTEADISTTSESNEIFTTEKMSDLTEKPIVRIPFMSSNNPDLSLILPSRNRTSWSDRRNRDRLGSLRLRIQEKHENETKPTESQHLENNVYGKLKFRNFNRITTAPTTETIDVSSSVEEVTTTTTTNGAPTTTIIPIKSSEILSNEDFDSIESSSFEIPKITPKYESNDEITELLKSGSNAKRLSRILESRNMTLEELLENRERGSQTKVEQLFEQKQNIQKIKETTTTTTTESTLKNTIADTHNEKLHSAHDLFPNFPEFNYDSKTVHNSKKQGKNEFEELIADESVRSSVRIKPENNQVDNREPRLFRNFPFFEGNNQRNMHINFAPSGIGSPLPTWSVNEKSIYNQYQYGYPHYETRYPSRDLITSRVNSDEREHFKKNDYKPIESSTIPENDIVAFETINKSAEANRNLKNSIDEILKEQTEINELTEEYEKAFIPPAVKSAIIASGVVLGIALFVFLAIFVACGCRQRHLRIRGKNSILNDSLSRSNSDRKSMKKNNTLSPISFKRSGMYKKALDFETASSVSNSSNASSYLWNTLKNTFTSRNNTLKNTLKNEEIIRQENEMRREEERRNTLRTKEDRSTMRRHEELERKSTLHRKDEDRGIFSRIDPDRNVINTSLTFKRGGINGSNQNRFNTCAHIKT